MLEEFKNYVSNFNMKLDGIKRKYNHSIRVMNLSIKYAKLLGYSDDDIELAAIIGLMHDIGRFEQYEKYKSFNDLKTFDHAIYGAKILFDDELINKFTDRVSDYEVIKFAIENHNKLLIEDTNDNRKIRFAKLIRDVDKLDIIYLIGYLNEYKYVICNDRISNNIVADIMGHRQINKRYINNENDHDVMIFGFAFDINNDIVLDELKRNYYYYYRKINHDGLFDKIYNEVIKYIDERIDNYVREKI